MVRRRRVRGGVAVPAEDIRASEQTRVRRRLEAEVREGAQRRAAAARGALDQALLEEVWLVDVLDRVGLLPPRHGKRRQPDRATAELLADGGEDVAVQAVQARLVDLQER